MYNIKKFVENNDPEYSLDSLDDIEYLTLIGSLKEANTYFKSPDCNVKDEDKAFVLASYLGKSYGYWFLDFYEQISTHLNQTNTKSDIHAVCDLISELFENVENIESMNEKEFFKKIELSSHPMIRILRSNSKNKQLFFKNILTVIKESKNSKHPLLTKLRELRQSSTGRRLITNRSKRNETLDLQIESLFKLFQEYGTANKAEIYMKLEKFIESGWYDKLNPLADFLSGKDSENIAFTKLKNAMGSCFFKGNVTSEQYDKYNEYTLSLNEKSKIGSDIFKIASKEQFDACIFSTDGKTLYISEVTTDESGEKNKNKWLSILKAIQNFKETNPDICVKFNINLLSLFYDDNEKTNIKQSVINMYENFNIKDRIDWQILQVLSCLSRESNDHSDLYELLSNMELNITGSKLEKYYNDIYSDNKQYFIDTVFSTFDNVFNKLISIDEFFQKTVEFDLISLLYNSFTGFEKLVCSSESNLQRYVDYKNKIEGLVDKMNVSDGGLGQQFKILKRSLNVDDLKEEYTKDKLHHEQSKNKFIEKKRIAKELEALNAEKNIAKLSEIGINLEKLSKLFENFISNQNYVRAAVVIAPLRASSEFLQKITDHTKFNTNIDYTDVYTPFTSKKTLLPKIKSFSSDLLRLIRQHANDTNVLTSCVEQFLTTRGNALVVELGQFNETSLFTSNRIVNSQNKIGQFGEYTLKQLPSIKEYEDKTQEQHIIALKYMSPEKATSIGRTLFINELNTCIEQLKICINSGNEIELRYSNPEINTVNMSMG